MSSLVAGSRVPRWPKTFAWNGVPKMRSTPCCFSRCWSWSCSVFLSIRSGRVAPDCRRPGMGGVSVCGGGGPESNLGAGSAQSGPRCLPRFPRPGEFAVSRQSAGKFIFVGVWKRLMTPSVHYVLQAARARPGVATDSGSDAGTWALVVNGTFFAAMSLRTRSREIMLPLLLFPISIPAILAMVNATTAILTGDIPAASGSYCLPPTMWCLLLLVCCCLKLCCTPNERAFPILAILTAILLGYALYEALVVAPTDQTMGNVQRIFYYHVPSAWTAFLLS